MVIWGSLKDIGRVNIPVTDSEIGLKDTGLLSLNCIPSLLKTCENGDEGVAFLIHCLYQALLSYKTEVPKRGETKTSKQDHFITATKYAYLSYMGSFATENQKTLAEEYVTNIVTVIEPEDLLTCLKRFFSTMPSMPMEITPTKYHYLINYLIIKNKDINDIIAGDLNRSLDELKKTFPY